ncbi:MAG: (2Fe-2S)-binding protein, partial [Cellulomonas sp.]|nr:(2Fe-2S)-binding protein [Cellulomonas sp.]
MVHLEINGHVTEVEPGTTILQAAQREHIEIPTMCYLEGVNQVGACRMCAVEVEGRPRLMTACETEATEGMVVRTNSARARHAREVLFELMMSDHPADCLHCARDGDCELQDLGRTLGVSTSRFAGKMSRSQVDDSSRAIVLDASKCILCRRCVSVCNEVQGVGALSVQNRGFHSQVGPGDLLLDQAACALCGQCTVVCPVDAIHEADGTRAVWQALADPSKTVVVQAAPAVRAALGEEFGLPAGTLVTGKMVSALRELGFDHVFDTNFAADLTIMEEGYELLGRLVAHFRGLGLVDDEQVAALGLADLPEPTLPMITSCSPGWIKYVEHFYPEHLAHLSSCKSPHMMLGALTKTWLAQRQGLDPHDVAGPQPPVRQQLVRRLLGPVPVAGEHLRTADEQLARLPLRQLAGRILLVDDTDLRRRPDDAERTRPAVGAERVAERDGRRLRHAVPLDDQPAGELLPPPGHLGRQRHRAGDRVADRREVHALPLGRPGQPVEHRRHGRHERRGPALLRREDHVHVEAREHDEGRGDRRPVGQADRQAERVEEGQHGVQDLRAVPRAQPRPRLHDVGEEVPVREHGALRRPGGAAGVLDERRVRRCRP